MGWEESRLAQTLLHERAAPVAPAGPGSSVTVTTTWKGAGGVKGFFEKTFAPLGLKKIQSEVLANLKKEVEG